jgi:hypothetical protein
MEMSQGNSLHRYFKQKCLFFKNRRQEGKTDPVWGLAPEGRGGYKERVQEVNMVEYYALMCENGKMRPAETSRNGEEEDKGE